MATDYATATATQLLGQLRRGTLSSTDLLEQLLARTHHYNPRINAVVTLDEERARLAAQRMDERAHSRHHVGVLHGLPMTVKDTMETAGVRTTAGVPALCEHVPEHNATAVQRLEDAGAVIFGKTNTPAWAADLQTTNDIFGTTTNPWHAEHTCGGSSGGAAASVAMGFTPLELGSDIGGSLRNPAHYCGVYSHKPSWGIVPDRGHVPGPPGTRAPTDLAVLGPVARSAEDLALALEVLAGPGDNDRTGWQLALPGARHDRLQDYRVAVYLDDACAPVDAQVGDVLSNAMDRLAAHGAGIVQQAPPVAMPEALDVYLRLLYAVTGGGMPQKVRESLRQVAAAADADDQSWPTRMARYSVLDHADWLVASELRYRYREQWRVFFGDFDVLLAPVTGVTAPRHNHDPDVMRRQITVNGRQRNYWEQLAWVGPLATLPGLPATVAPLGLAANGLPVGIQIIGPWLEDYTPIRFAELMAPITGGFTPPSLD